MQRGFGAVLRPLEIEKNFKKDFFGYLCRYKNLIFGPEKIFWMQLVFTAISKKIKVVLATKYGIFLYFLNFRTFIYPILYELKNSFLDDLITHTYLSKCEMVSNAPEAAYSEPVEFLKGLNTINGTSFNLLVGQLINILKSDSFKNFDRELIYKLLALLSINGNDHMATQIMSELIVIPHKLLVNQNNSADESLLIKMRQEITPFHSECISKTINSIINSFDYQKNEENMSYFLENVVSLYEWDLQNQNFMRLFLILNSKFSFMNI